MVVQSWWQSDPWLRGGMSCSPVHHFTNSTSLCLMKNFSIGFLFSSTTTLHIFDRHMYKNPLWKCFEKICQWSSVNMLWVEVFFSQTTSNISKWGFSTNIWQKSFCWFLFWQHIADKVIVKCWQVLLEICQIGDFVIWRALVERS